MSCRIHRYIILGPVTRIVDVEVFEMPIYIFNSNVDCGFGIDITKAVVY